MKPAAWRSALVTGAGSGIGRALAIELARVGVGDVALCGRQEAPLHEVARAVERHGARATVLVLDVTAAHAVDRLRSLDDALGGLDLVIANAGVGAGREHAPWAWETLRDALHTNLCGAAATLTANLEAMVRRGRGHLCGVGSLSGLGALPGSAAYCTPKAGLRMLLDCLRLDLAPRGVAVTHLCLGFVRTAMVAASTHPLPQLLEPEAVAREASARLARRPREIVLPRALGALVRAAAVPPGALRDALVLAAARRVPGA